MINKFVEQLQALGLDVEQLETDVAIVGGGGAASRAALSARLTGAEVLVLSKAPLGTGGSTVHGASEIMSMGASGYGDVADGPEVHYRDTMAAASGFIDRDLVRVLAEDAPKRIADLIEYGVAFDRLSADKQVAGRSTDYKLIQSDFGSYARALGVSGKTGKAFVAALNAQALERGVKVRAPAGLVDVLLDQQGRAAGVLAFDSAARRWLVVRAKAIVLGTGGAHGLFSQQVSTSEMTGDAQAVMYRAGAELVNMEFHQFGPALVHPYVQLFSKSCFVLHPKLTNGQGHEFLADYLPEGVTEAEVMDEKVFPFTVSNVSRYLDIAIAAEIAAGRGTPRGTIHLSLAHVPLDRMEATIPNTMRWMKANGVDPTTDLMDVGIAFQCLNGGVRMVDADARSTLPGVHVIGELSGGVRGPDRPGGNSLAEGQVFGHRAGDAAGRAALAGDQASSALAVDGVVDRLRRALAPNPGLRAEESARALQAAMQRHALVEKNEAGLTEALALAKRIETDVTEAGGATPDTLSSILTLQNMATTASLILEACLARKETRSGHLRTDYPDKDDAHYGHAFVQTRGEDGRSRFSPLAYPAAD
ncbi:FAD-binding protein [Aquincola sp. MAHUQ-54]|uniref:FAD-binding protein n=1 Tax=Aquincola agrisoli TaxID=3119538 RepID=A0AAW9QLV8_9BURK